MEGGVIQSAPKDELATMADIWQEYWDEHAQKYPRFTLSRGKMLDLLIAELADELELTEELSKEYIKVALEDIKTFDKKQHDYSSSNIAIFGEFGVLVRVNDKMARLRNLQGKEAANEGIEDSWRDLSVYGVIARMIRAGVWPGCK